MPEIPTIPRRRRLKPRPAEVILGALDERVRCLPLNDNTETHLARITELIDELRRSLGQEAAEEPTP